MHYPVEEENELRSIAIIGIAGRFPGARDIGEFWENMKAGTDSISHFSSEEMAAGGVNVSAVVDDPNHVSAGGVLEHADRFDAAFFGILPREAEYMDPQGRVILECAWHALEDAGYNVDDISGPVGVYAGMSRNTYFIENLLPNAGTSNLVNDFQTLVNNESDSLAARISYKLNLTGPSVSVGTACSTSLVAVFQACESLLNYHSDMALAGGVSVRVPQERGASYQEGGIRSADGATRAFDKNAQGMASSNGVGLVVLKRLSEAEADGDNIYGVIRGIAINNDGGTKVGFAAPSVTGQADAIVMAQAMANVDPSEISYIEAHGTATPLGDPIEMASLTQAFRTGTDKVGYCGIGSVKSNVGHLDAAAGVTGLIKLVLALRHEEIPPSIHYHEPNPGLELETSPFYVTDQLTKWERNGTLRIGGVNSFGVGGTNAHAIVSEAPKIEDHNEPESWQLLPVSARNDKALSEASINLARHFRDSDIHNMADVAFTLQMGRRAFGNRRFVLAQNAHEAYENLANICNVPDATGVSRQEPPKVVFMFPGQGSQYVNMGRELYESEPVVREHIDHCAEVLEPRIGFDLRDIIYPDAADEEEASRKLKETSVAQPAIFTVEYALAKLWMSRGVVPERMIGHSIGEFTAACLAGVFSLDDALSLLATRGRLMGDLPGGDMMAVPMSETDLIPLLGDGVSIAAVNSPSSCVVSGPHEAVIALESRLKEQDVLCRPLHTSHAFHSSMMDPILETFTEHFQGVNLNPPAIDFISSPTGKSITATEATDPAYWARHLREPVRFADGRMELANDPESILLEVGPGSALASLSRYPVPGSDDQLVLSSLGHVLEDHQDTVNLLTAMGRLWVEGVPVDFASLHSGAKRRRVSLPGYPFERKRYWIDAPATVNTASTTANASELGPGQVATHLPQPIDTGVAVKKPINGVSNGGNPVVDESLVEQIMSQQLRLMNEQLLLLAGVDSANSDAASNGTSEDPNNSALAQGTNYDV